MSFFIDVILKYVTKLTANRGVKFRESGAPSFPRSQVKLSFLEVGPAS